MGADIHLCVEKINKSGEWEAVKRVIQEEVNYYEKKLKESEGKTYDYRAYYEERLKEAKEGSLYWAFNNRSYSVFAVLADVRNEAGIEPIDYPRGLPSDVSSLIREEYQTFKDECCEGEVHSASWFTLKELLEFEWDKEVIHKGVVCEDTYRDLRESGCLIPSYFYRWVEGVHNDVLLSMDQMNDILDGKTERNPEVEYSVEMTWMESHASKCSNFIYAMKKLTELSDSGDLSDVRIVFWFDN